MLNHLPPLNYAVTYWRRADHEVDFVVASGTRTWAIEVKSGRAGKRGGLQAFRRQYPAAQPLVVGGGGLPLDEFLLSPPEDLLVAGWRVLREV
jgi:hypothetical protein